MRCGMSKKYLAFCVPAGKFPVISESMPLLLEIAFFCRDTVNVIPTLPYDVHIEVKKYFCRHMWTLKYLLGDDILDNTNEF